MRQTRIAMIRGGLLALAALAAVGTPPARATVLRWKFKPGDTLHYVMDQKTTSTEKAGAQEIKTALSQTITMSWAVRDVGSDGSAEMAQTIERVRTKIESPFGTFDYDSASPKAPDGLIGAGLVPLLKALVGATFTFKMSPQGELSDVKVPDTLVKALSAAGPAGGSMFSEEGLKNMIVESSLGLPPDDLAAGKTWTRQTKVGSPIGPVTLDKSFTYRGPAPDHGPGVDRIDLVTKVELPPTPEGGIPFKVKSQDRKGAFYFDTAAGRVTDSQVIEDVETSASFNNVEIVKRNTTTTTMKLQ